MPSLKHRSNTLEMMDDLSSSTPDMDQTLKELNTINSWLGGNRVTLNGIKKLINSTHQNLKIVDMGCGGGDILKMLANWGRQNSIQLELIGIDANAGVVDYANRNCCEYPEITIRQMDIFSEQFKNMSFDILTASLFTHHFTSDELISLFRNLKQQTRLGIVINDLHRNWLAYIAISLLTAVFSRSKMIRHDAGISVLRGFNNCDLQDIFKESGIHNFRIKWKWAFRWQVIIGVGPQNC